MRFDTQVLHTLPPWGPGGCVMGELSLSTRSSAAGPASHLRYAGKLRFRWLHPRQLRSIEFGTLVRLL